MMPSVSVVLSDEKQLFRLVWRLLAQAKGEFCFEIFPEIVHRGVEQGGDRLNKRARVVSELGCYFEGHSHLGLVVDQHDAGRAQLKHVEVRIGPVGLNGNRQLVRGQPSFGYRAGNKQTWRSSSTVTLNGIIIQLNDGEHSYRW